MKCFVGTRKGLFSYEFQHNRWQIIRRQFLGDPVPMLLPATSDKIMAALGTGHFGIKLHRSDDRGVNFQEVSTPTYPEKPKASDDPVPWNLEMIWALEQGKDQRLWCGTIPGGLFSSDDWGESWQLNESLWQVQGRKLWAGGGYDHPGIHSICVRPDNANELTIAVSIGGVYRSQDNGETWVTKGKGLRANYVTNCCGRLRRRVVTTRFAPLY